MTEQELLELWEATWGQLDAHWQTVFLARTELPAILLYDDDAIATAIQQRQRLASILELLRDPEGASSGPNQRGKPKRSGEPGPGFDSGTTGYHGPGPQRPTGKPAKSDL